MSNPHILTLTTPSGRAIEVKLESLDLNREDPGTKVTFTTPAGGTVTLEYKAMSQGEQVQEILDNIDTLMDSILRRQLAELVARSLGLGGDR